MSPKATSKSSKLPFVIINFAMTADGKIAFSKDHFTPFGSERDRTHMMELRATADALLSGARTVHVTHTVLGNGGSKFRRQRLKNKLREFPLRIIASGAGSIDPNSEIFKERFSPIIILTTERIPRKKLEAFRAVAEVAIFGKKELDFPAAFRWLRKQWKVRRLLCEGGGELHDALIHADLVNELHLTICPKIFGGRNAPTIADSKKSFKLADAKRFQLVSMKENQGELFAVFASK
ncbi:MAG TPA: dihydrofolate reductase family protein [Verrucomicrobiae bacterium]